MYKHFLKRIIDFVLALIGIIILGIPMIIIAIFIKLDSKGPVFYKQKRCGLYKKPFYIIKFRSMIYNADKVGSVITSQNDNRITKVGNFLRKNKLDEFPQLFNIIKGDMSFIGPRPETYVYADTFSDEEQIIFTVRPGITDFASLKLNAQEELMENDDNPDEFYVKYILRLKNKLRIKYVSEISFYTDAKLFWLTFLNTLMKLLHINTKL